MITPEQFQALRTEAESWLGTPFAPNSNTKGRGVSCQKLASEIYRAAGICDVQVPDVPMAHARFSRESLLEKFMDDQKVPRVTEPQAGDLLGFRIGRTVHHCGIYLGDGQFVHAMEHIGTVISSLNDPTWKSRLVVIWRPYEKRGSE